MIRTANLTESSRDDLRRTFHNPLFQVMVRQFDDVFLEEALTPNFFYEYLYVKSPTVDYLLQNMFRDSSPDPGLLYFLLGRKGQGKTVALRDFYTRLTQPTDTRARVALYFDLKSKKSNTAFLANIQCNLIELIFETVKSDPNVRKDVSAHITVPSAIREIDANYRGLTDEMLHQRLLDHKGEAARYLLRWLAGNNTEIVLIFDNVDDFPKSAICRLIDACAELRDLYNAKCLIALRDYWNPASLGIEDQHISSLHLCEPNVYEIVCRRLAAMDLKDITKDVVITYGGRRVVLHPPDLVAVFEDICEAFACDNTIGGQLLRLSNHNVREYLKNIYYFFHSPYLFAKPIFIKALVKVIQQEDPEFYPGRIRSLRFHDFIECFMAIHSLCYDDESRLFNLFYHDFPYPSGPGARNTLIFLRVLQIAKQDNTPFPVNMILSQMEAVGYQNEAIRNAVQLLLDASILESTEGIRISDIGSIQLSVKGTTYLELILPEYTYCMFISDVVPMPDKHKVSIYDKFGDEAIPIQRGALCVKHTSVQKFLAFLKAEEKEEERLCPADKVSVLRRIKGDKLEEISGKVQRAMARMIASDNPRAKEIVYVGLFPPEGRKK